MERIFTPEEANAALDELRPVAERMVEHRRALTAAQRRQASLVVTIAGNGGDLGPSDLQEAAAEIQRAAERDGEAIFLCWKVGEERVSFWHGVDEGFAGRKPLDA